MENKLQFEEDFFKSNELDGNGKIIEKSIPTVKIETIKKEITVNKERKVTKEVENFVKKTEAHFKQMDEMVKDTCKQSSDKGTDWDQEGAVEMKLLYNKFKQRYSRVVNNLINYPNEGKREEERLSSVKSEWDKSRIRI